MAPEQRIGDAPERPVYDQTSPTYDPATPPEDRPIVPPPSGPDRPYAGPGYVRDDGPPPRRGGGCLLSLVSAFLGALLGAGLVAALLLSIWGVSGPNKSTSSGGSTETSGGVNINTNDQITYAEAVAKKDLPSVVLVGIEQTAQDPHTGRSIQQLVGNGSGVIIREDGYILTNDHVVSGSEALVVQLDGEQVPAKVVGEDPSSDLAVIKIERTGLRPIEIGSSKGLQVGQPVVAIGSPFGLDKTVTSGIISALGRSSLAENAGASVTAYTSLIQTDAAINPGNSGGALTDAEGRLIGINTLIQTGGSGADQSAGVGFAIPIDYAKQIAEQLINTGKAEHPFLGISTMTVTPDIKQQFNLTVDVGAYVDSVQSGSAAEKAGIKAGDVIVKIGGMKIETVEDVFAAVRSHKVGDTVDIEFVRGGQQQTVTATLGSDTQKQ